VLLHPPVPHQLQWVQPVRPQTVLYFGGFRGGRRGKHELRMSSALGGWSTSLCPHPHMSLVTPTLFSSLPVSVLVPNCFPRNVVVRDLSAAPRFPTPLPGTPRRCRFFSPLWGSPLRLSSLLALPLCPPPPPYPHARRPIDGHSSSQYLNAVGRPPAPPVRLAPWRRPFQAPAGPQGAPAGGRV